MTSTGTNTISTLSSSAAEPLRDYEREPGSFEFICRAQWVSVQGEPDYEVTDPETGQRHTVTATPFQKEAGYHALVQMMRIAMKS